MANRERTDRKTGTSLLWEPPKSSDTLGSVLLMPVLSSQSPAVVSSDNTSAFVGQQVGEDRASKVLETNSVHSFSTSVTETPSAVSSSKSQLNQPLRVRQSSPAFQPPAAAMVPSEMSQYPPRSSRGSSPMTAPISTIAAPDITATQHNVPSTASPAILPNVSLAETASVTSHSSFVTGMTSSHPATSPGYSTGLPLQYRPPQAVNSQGAALPLGSGSYYPPSEGHSQPAQPSGINPGSVPYSGNEPNVPSYSVTPIQSFYVPVEAHWFYRKVIERRDVWFPFSRVDSMNLEDSFKKNSEHDIVPTDGGRYDVIIKERTKEAVYWEEEPLSVRRCTWFYKSEGPQRYSPYEEELAAKLEEYYHMCCTSNKWGQRMELTGSEIVVIQSPLVIMHYIPSNHMDDWTSITDHKFKQRIVKRGLDEMMPIEDGESMKIDHLVFVVQGIGAVCDLRFRTVAECVDGFREIANNLTKVHFKNAFESGRIGRVEFLPVSWHSALHTDDTGVDRRMKCITLPSIPKLRHFTNDTLLDILYYSSPVYCQTILDSVGDQINNLYHLFVTRNPQFSGNVSVAGHSLGSLILFDILASHPSPGMENTFQNNEPYAHDISEVDSNPSDKDNFASENLELSDADSKPDINSVLQKLNLQEYLDKFIEEKIDVDILKTLEEEDIKNLGLPMGPRKKLLSHIKSLNESSKEEVKPTVAKNVKSVESQQTAGNAWNESPFMEIDQQSTTFSNQTVTSQYPVSLQKNIYSPIKYPRLVFSPSCFFALGSPISMFLTIRGFNSISEDFKLPTCASFFNIFHPFDPVAFRIETLIDQSFTAKPVVIPHHKGRKRLHIELKEGLSRVGYDLKQKLMESLKYTWNSISEFAKAHAFPTATVEAEVDKIVQEQMADEYESESTVSGTDACRDEDIQIGQLNSGRRIDYVLQEKPIESLNEYLFALTSHATYWDSEDTVLMILREVYALESVFPSPPYKDNGKIHLYNPSLTPLSSMGFQPPQLTITSASPTLSIYSPGQPSKLDVMSPLSQQLPSVPPQVPSPQSIANVSNLPSMNPQTPVAPAQPIGPPPLSGFVKRSALAKH